MADILTQFIGAAWMTWALIAIGVMLLLGLATVIILSSMPKR
jgi:hypothetical protein